MISLFFTPGLKSEIMLVRLMMVDVINVLNGHSGSLKILAFAPVLYPTLGVTNGDAKAVCQVEPGRGGLPASQEGDALMACLQAG